MARELVHELRSKKYIPRKGVLKISRPNQFPQIKSDQITKHQDLFNLLNPFLGQVENSSSETARKTLHTSRHYWSASGFKRKKRTNGGDGRLKQHNLFVPIMPLNTFIFTETQCHVAYEFAKTVTLRERPTTMCQT